MSAQVPGHSLAQDARRCLAERGIKILKTDVTDDASMVAGVVVDRRDLRTARRLGRFA
ncbi:hypothetical protein [Amycolatopsis sp. cmx-11-51]|uniref:hypothetical protein n=1 Tax=Amycolatopsis sp. cmx-11-51 TaxID=2785797 RepID=UPI0039E6A2C0